jgi:hypothetical protein
MADESGAVPPGNNGGFNMEGGENEGGGWSR